MKNEHPQQEDRPEFLESVEFFFSKLILFLKKLFFTLFMLITAPRKFGSTAQNKPSSYIGPSTFLCLAGFFSIKIAKFAIICLLIGFAASMNSCRPEFYQDAVFPSPTDSFSLPSLEEILFVGTPLILGTLLLSRVIKFIVIKNNSITNDSFYLATCYAIGLQYLLWLPISLILYGKGASYFPDSSLANIFSFEEFSDTTLFGLLGYIIIGIIWPAICFCNIINRPAVYLASRPKSVIAKKITLILCGLLLTSTTLALTLAIVLPLAKSEFDENYSSTLLMRASLVKQEDVFSLYKETPIIITNNTQNELQIMLSDLIITSNEKSYKAVVSDAQTNDKYFFTIKSKQQIWVTLIPIEEIESKTTTRGDVKTAIWFQGIFYGDSRKTIGVFIF